MKSYHDIVGDGGSRVLEQVDAQQARIERALSGVRHRVAIGSGKGGVGKSTLTQQLAVALRAEGHSVAILDADLNGPSQARLSGLRGVPLVPDDGRLSLPKSRAGIGVVSLGALVPEERAVDFESVAGGDSHIWRATREFTFLGQMMATVKWGRLDFLLVDLPPGAERTFQYAGFLGPECAFILITIPTALSKGVVARSIAALDKTPNRVLGYIENMSGYSCDGCGAIRPLFPAASSPDLGIPRLGTVPFDPRLAELNDHGTPVPAVREVIRRVTSALDGTEDER